LKKELIYIGDPMCSWCWGFSPVLQKIRKQFQDHLAFSVIVGGLRAGTSEILNEDLKQYIRGHWTEVNKMTGQPFSFDFLYRTQVNQSWQTVKKELIYIGDPMCSWCWGFSPVWQEIRKQFQDHLAFSVMVGGLRSGISEVLNEELKQYIRGHWTEVNQMTGQPFSFDFFNRDNFIYNTEPACRAIVTIRNLKPNLVFSYFESLHYSFYVENHDITTTAVLASNGEKIGVANETFQPMFNSQKIIDETSSDFETVKKMGVFGFPSLVLKEDEKIIPVSRGYQTLDALSSRLKELLAPV